MIRTYTLDCHAANPQMPLEPVCPYTGSAATFILVNLPRPHGKQRIDAVTLSITNADAAVSAHQATREGSSWIVTVPASAIGPAGNVKESVIISASGVDEQNRTVPSWIVAVADLRVRNQDGTAVPGEPRVLISWFESRPANPRGVFICPAQPPATGLDLFDGTSYRPLITGGSIETDDIVTHTSANPVKSSGIWSAIWGALTAIPTGFTSLYDWCVAKLGEKRDKTDAAVWEKTWDFSWCSPSFMEWNWKIDGRGSPYDPGTLFDGNLSVANVIFDDIEHPTRAEIVYVFEDLPPYYTAPEGSGCGIEVGKHFDATTSELSRSFVHAPDATTSGIAAFDDKGKLKAATAGTDYATPDQIPTGDDLVSAKDRTKWNGKYTKPSGGIPASDIASGVIPDIAPITAKTSHLESDGTADATFAADILKNADRIHSSDGVGYINGDGDVWAVDDVVTWIDSEDPTIIFAPVAGMEDVWKADDGTFLWYEEIQKWFCMSPDIHDPHPSHTGVTSKDSPSLSFSGVIVLNRHAGEGELKKIDEVAKKSYVDGDMFATDLLGKQVAISAMKYGLASTSTTVKAADRTVTKVTLGTTAVTVTFPDADENGKTRDFLLRIDAANLATGGSLTITKPTGATIYGDAFPSPEATKQYLVAITETAANEFYVRTIEITIPMEA